MTDFSWPQSMRRAPIWVVRLAAVIGAVTVVAGAAIYVGKAIDRQWFWRGPEYTRLKSLVAGMPLQRFIAVLGSPAFARDSNGGRYRESTFKGREYWAQAISATDGTVVEYAVTSCSPDFTPTFTLGGTGFFITLQRSKMIDVESNEGGRPVDYFVSTTGGGRSHFYDEDPGGNGSYYKQLAWGFNDACSDGLDKVSSYLSSGLVKLSGSTVGQLNTEASWVERFRRVEIANTFAETSPNVEFRDLNGLTFGEHTDPVGFAIGADRLLTRQIQGEAPSNR